MLLEGSSLLCASVLWLAGGSRANRGGRGPVCVGRGRPSFCPRHRKHWNLPSEGPLGRVLLTLRIGAVLEGQDSHLASSTDQPGDTGGESVLMKWLNWLGLFFFTRYVS